MRLDHSDLLSESCAGEDRQQFLTAAADCDAMIIRSDKADKAMFDAAKKLKIIVRAGAGVDNIDLNAATEKGVVAINTPGTF